MNQQDQEALQQLAAATEPGVKITRQGYAAIEEALAYLQARLTLLSTLEKKQVIEKDTCQHSPSPT